MEMPLYENEVEREDHSRSMRSLAVELAIPERRVRELYEALLRELKSGAKVKGFLPVLVAKKLKADLRRAEERTPG